MTASAPLPDTLPHRDKRYRAGPDTLPCTIRYRINVTGQAVYGGSPR